MSSDDPFAERGDAERTVIRPNPGGRLGQAPRAAAAPTPGPGPGDGTLLQSLVLPHLNPIVVAAVPLLSFAVRLKNTAAHGNVEALRDSVIAEINAFERRITPLGLSPQAIAGAKYALSATIDDLVLNTPWGSRSVWSTKSMVGTFFRQTFGGDRFFDLLDNLKRDAALNIDQLELIYCCLALGFEGKYRVMPRGQSELALLREDLFRLIRNNRGEFERELSPHWQGVAAAHRGLTAIVPLWVVAAVVAGILTLAFAGFTYALNTNSDATFATIGTLPPTGAVTLARVAPPLPPAAAVQSTEAERIRRFLAAEIAQGLVTVIEDPSTITVRIRNTGMFPSGSADIQSAFLPVLVRIGDAVNTEPGPLTIAGYTDNVPIRGLKFPSNWHLSVARAKAVQTFLAGRVKDPGRLNAEGKADADPVASNATPDGREQNRRIEIALMKAG
jgi:type VI secretion system protein ImpK